MSDLEEIKYSEMLTHAWKKSEEMREKDFKEWAMRSGFVTRERTIDMHDRDTQHAYAGFKGAWTLYSHPMRDWQPIETAPKDGRKFLAFFNDRIFIIRFCTYLRGFSSEANRSDEVSHWMPLPEPPEEKL